MDRQQAGGDPAVADFRALVAVDVDGVADALQERARQVQSFGQTEQRAPGEGYSQTLRASCKLSASSCEYCR
ncbi:hypothetical protein [Amycolatopsis sp. cmx-4-54]|uniref:hypothetical protein n=1 Tax=Amycolatopsis sp. cmx-4-54 TaxID=2790936 RepID=UPI00397A8500